MIKHFIPRCTNRRSFATPQIIVGRPVLARTPGSGGIQEIGRKPGARRVFLIEEPMGGSDRAGLPVTETTGRLVVDVGGGTTGGGGAVAGGIVYYDRFGSGVTRWTEAIHCHISAANHKLLVGESSAERIKNPNEKDRSACMPRDGRDA